MANWFSVATPGEVERLLLAWPGAPEDQDELLELILDVAREQIMQYAPGDAFVQGVFPTPRLVYAQLQQAINLYNAGAVAPNGDIGPEGYSFTPRPLDKTIRAIIRPTSGVADVF